MNRRPMLHTAVMLMALALLAFLSTGCATGVAVCAGTPPYYLQVMSVDRAEGIPWCAVVVDKAEN